MQSVKTIRAVERAFQVLEALQRTPEGATLAQLQAETGLSGPTLLRLLKTLTGVKAVRRSTADQRYRPGMRLTILTRDIAPAERLADVAAPWIDELCEQLEWPSDLAVHMGNDDFVKVLESSLRQSRFYLRRRPGRVRINLLGSAAGMAFVSALPRDRRNELVAAARAGRDIHNAKVIAAGDLEQHVASARRRGYSLRHPLYRGGSFNGEPRDDALQAMAVPVIAHGRLLGALNLNWNRAAASEREMAKRSLPALQRAVAGIAEAAADAGLVELLPGLEDAEGFAGA